MIEQNLFTNNADRQILEDLEKAILRNVGGLPGLQEKFPKLIRRAIDEVIDMPRTGRRTLQEIEPTEKTYIGTKIEILFRTLIGYPKGLLDLNIDGLDVDIKHTTKSDWMIPPEAIEKPCVLISESELTATCNLGIVIARADYMRAGSNRDLKGSIAAKNRDKIHWILNNYPYPKNIWQFASKDVIERIFLHKSGTARISQIFIEMPGVPVSRSIIEGIAQQKDSLKRTRKNGGARDKLKKEGLVLLSGAYDNKLIHELGLSYCARDEFISYKPNTDAERKLLKDKLD